MEHEPIKFPRDDDDLEDGQVMQSLITLWMFAGCRDSICNM